jgi:SAM-dependent methyltransferase
MKLLIVLVIIIIGWLLWKYWTLLLGAGYDPTPMNKVIKMLELAAVGKGDLVYDLGSGDGRLLITATKKFGAHAIGIEADPFRFLFSWIHIVLAGQRKRARVELGNFFNKDIGDASVVTLFLFQPTNNKLKKKFIEELKPGTRIVSYTWTFDGWNVQTCLPEDRIYLYIMESTGIQEKCEEEKLIQSQIG